MTNLLQTGAHAFAFTLGLLAFYPEFQEQLFQNVQTVLQGRHPVRLLTTHWV